jgi:hypothetical protein
MTTHIYESEDIAAGIPDRQERVRLLDERTGRWRWVVMTNREWRDRRAAARAQARDGASAAPAQAARGEAEDQQP